ncbi:MAG TPA: urea transporter [Terriglobia bacterium]|nr:urea transporter [Terriglobia bacterium]
MAMRLSSTGLVADGNTPTESLLSFLDSVLRGVGQVMLQNNSYAGLFFLAGIFYNSRLFGLAVVVGTAVSTASAMLLEVEPSKVREGLFGFNGALVAVALTYFLQTDALTWAYVVFAAIAAAVLTAAMSGLLETWSVPVLTAPFVLTALCFLLACAHFGRLHSTHVLPTAGLPTTAIVEGVVSASTVVEGLFKGVAQVFFQNSVVTGVLFLAGLLVSSRRMFLAALLGSLTGLFVAWGMGAAEPAIRSGAFGFNCVLTAIAMVSLGFELNKGASAFYILLATIASAIVFAATSTALKPLGMPALTLPFVLAVWIFLLAGRQFPGLLREMPNRVPTDEFQVGGYAKSSSQLSAQPSGQLPRR